ncbi:accessory gene regulator ArgB-like protein [Desulfitispora alkaliphila]|uniref:accessory gene regulator ArgB-like protein n=1 Tax=Desulfitispora alkaliphila TaxID=622674 RepID=UPI003D1B13BC
MGQNTAERLGDIVGLNNEDKEVIAYGLEQVISNSFTIAITLLVGFFMGVLLEVVTIILCLALARRLVGGAHCTTPWRCAVASCFLITITALVSKLLCLMVSATLLIILFFTGAIVITWIWAPNDSEKKPINDVKKRKRLRLHALTIEVILAFVFIVIAKNSETYQLLAVAGAGGVATMSFTATPLGHKLMARFDKFLGGFFYKKGR